MVLRSRRGDVEGNRMSYGWLFVHFRDGPGGESIHFSLSAAQDPLKWTPLYGGAPRMVSDVGTRGVRDPVLVRSSDSRFHVLATDLCVEHGADGWDQWVRTGSRSLVIWDSDDLVNWSAPRLVEVAPEEAGMAWAPEVVHDPATGDAIVFWSSRLYDKNDLEHQGESYSRVLFSRTRDFEFFSPTGIMVDDGTDIIDTAILTDGEQVHRISKSEDAGAISLGVYHEVGSGIFANDFRPLSTRIGRDLHGNVEGPIVFRSQTEQRWYLFLDQYSSSPQGYVAFTSENISSGKWEPISPAEFDIPPGTKHGGILPLTREEWNRLAEHVETG